MLPDLGNTSVPALSGDGFCSSRSQQEKMSDTDGLTESSDSDGGEEKKRKVTLKLKNGTNKCKLKAHS